MDKMKRLLVYSHDTYGLGNIRRMLSICTYLIENFQDLSILVISSSPMIHALQVPNRLDYLKLPCLTRSREEGYAVKYLGTDIEETIKLRARLIRSAVESFKPELFLVDKKPFGINNELEDTLNHIKSHLPETRIVLLLRDILDRPEATIKTWEKQRYFKIIEHFYDRVLIVGTPEVFNMIQEYRFPEAAAEKVRFCGYIERERGRKTRETLRKELGLRDEPLVLVTPGGGQDGYRLLETYIASLPLIPRGVKSLVISGPEMPEHQKHDLSEAMLRHENLKVLEFTDDMMGYMNAADVVVSMGGYNTVCEILTLKKRAIVVPRVKPVEEQAIRAERMARLNLFRTIHPDHLNPKALTSVLREELEAEAARALSAHLDMGALPKITKLLATL